MLCLFFPCPLTLCRYGSTCWVEGRIGLGKSHLLRQLAHCVVTSDVTAVWGVADPFSMHKPLYTWKQVCVHLLHVRVVFFFFECVCRIGRDATDLCVAARCLTLMMMRPLWCVACRNIVVPCLSMIVRPGLRMQSLPCGLSCYRTCIMPMNCCFSTFHPHHPPYRLKTLLLFLLLLHRSLRILIRLSSCFNLWKCC